MPTYNVKANLNLTLLPMGILAQCSHLKMPHVCPDLRHLPCVGSLPSGGTDTCHSCIPECPDPGATGCCQRSWAGRGTRPAAVRCSLQSLSDRLLGQTCSVTAQRVLVCAGGVWTGHSSLQPRAPRARMATVSKSLTRACLWVPGGMRSRLVPGQHPSAEGGPYGHRDRYPPQGSWLLLPVQPGP